MSKGNSLVVIGVTVALVSFFTWVAMNAQFGDPARMSELNNPLASPIKFVSDRDEGLGITTTTKTRDVITYTLVISGVDVDTNCSSNGHRRAERQRRPRLSECFQRAGSSYQRQHRDLVGQCSCCAVGHNHISRGTHEHLGGHAAREQVRHWQRLARQCFELGDDDDRALSGLPADRAEAAFCVYPCCSQIGASQRNYEF
jgi:uncharacterized protein YjiS (DUF1127 family)